MHICVRQMPKMVFEQSVGWNCFAHNVRGAFMAFQIQKMKLGCQTRTFLDIAWISHNEQNLFTNRQIVHVKFRNAFAKRQQLWPWFCVFVYQQICIWRINFVVFQMCFAQNATFAFWEQNLGNRFWTPKLTSTNLIMSSSDALTLLKFGMPFCACISEFESATYGLYSSFLIIRSLYLILF